MKDNCEVCGQSRDWMGGRIPFILLHSGETVKELCPHCYSQATDNKEPPEEDVIWK